MKDRRIRALDWTILAFVVLAVIVNFTGGFYAEPGGVRVSMRKFERPLALALILMAVRAFLDRRTPPLGVPWSQYRAWWHAWFNRDADPPLAPGARRWWHSVLAVAGILAFGAFFMRPQLANMMGVSDFGDPFFSIWRVGWIFQQLNGDPRPLFDANIFHPTPLTLTFSDSILLIGLTGAPFLAAGLHPVVVYNILMVSAFLLSGIAVYFLAVRLTGSAMAAFIAGVLYGFHPYRFEHYGHLEQVSTHWIPLALLALLRFAESWKTRWAIVAALCMVAQLYTCMYIGVFFPIYAVAVIGTLLVVRARPPWRQLATPLGVAAVIAVAAALPLARPFMAAQALKGERSEDAVRFYSADVSDYLRPHERSALYHGVLPSSAERPERALFPGATVLVLAAAGLAPPIGTVRLGLTVGMVLGVDLSRGMKGFTYPTLYRTVPGVSGMRVPARFSIIVGLSLVALAAYGARRLVGRIRSRGGRALAWMALIAFTAIDLRPTLNLETAWAEPPRIYQHVKDVPNAVLAEFPFDASHPHTDEVMYQYFSNWHWKQMVNGYSGFVLDEHKLMVEELRSFPADDAIAVLRGRGVTHVTINCYLIGDPCKAYLEDVDRQPALKLINISHWMGRPTRIYELLR